MKTLATAALLTLAALAVTPHADAAPLKRLPACAFEDSKGPCYWDAATRGNGKGRSFWVDAHNRIHYIKK